MQLEDARSGVHAVRSFLQPEQAGNREPAAVRLEPHFFLLAPFGDRSRIGAFFRPHGNSEEEKKATQHLLRLYRGTADMPTTLIRNGTVVTAEGSVAADILVDGETIRDIAPGLPAEAAGRVIDAAGMLLLPGGIDVHTHLDMPFGGTTSSDDFETGTRAAAFGGTTTLVDFAIQARGTRMRDALDTWWKKAEGTRLHRLRPAHDRHRSGRLPAWKIWTTMVDEGVASFKLFMAYPNVLMVDDATIFKALSQHGQERRADLHARRKRQRDRRDRARARWRRARPRRSITRSRGPPRAEAEAVHRAIAMAEIAGAPVYIVHLSSEDALNQVREARDRGVPAFAETCPQYLLLSIEELARPGFEGAKYVFTPPLREKQHLPKLWDGLKHDHLQVVSTDHCPFCFEDQKVAGQGRFHQDSQRRARHREPAAAYCITTA